MVSGFIAQESSDKVAALEGLVDGREDIRNFVEAVSRQDLQCVAEEKALLIVRI
jgi:hypothetical protein